MCFIRFPNTEKYSTARRIFNSLLGDWKSDETLISCCLSRDHKVCSLYQVYIVTVSFSRQITFYSRVNLYDSCSLQSPLTLLRRTRSLWHVTWNSRLRDLGRGLLRMPSLLLCLWLLLLWKLRLRLGHLWLRLKLPWGGCRGGQVTGCGSCS